VSDHGVRNIRQALASPHPALVHRFGAARQEPNMSTRRSRLAVAALAALLASGCGLALRNPDIAELKTNPARYHDRSVNIDGVVTTSWGVPLMPFRLYKVDDGTGEVTVISNGSRLPTRGARVRVKGRVNEVAVFGGQALGLHLREESLRVRRGD
jgi:hypothetical protein